MRSNVSFLDLKYLHLISFEALCFMNWWSPKHKFTDLRDEHSNRRKRFSNWWRYCVYKKKWNDQDFSKWKGLVIKSGKSFANENILEQGFPTWGTFTPRGAFAYPKGCILRLSIEEQNIFEYDLFRNIYTYINEYSFQKSLYAFQKIIIFQFRFNINELLSVTCVGKSAVNRWNEATSRQTQIFLFYFARFVFPLRCLRVEMIQAKRFS